MSGSRRETLGRITQGKTRGKKLKEELDQLADAGTSAPRKGPKKA